MASDETMKAIIEALSGPGFLNGARSFGDQATWMMGGYGNAPQPAPYDGGMDYPAKNDANAYVRNNYPSGWGMQQPVVFAGPQTWRR